jgi:hypothetical protein
MEQTQLAQNEVEPTEVEKTKNDLPKKEPKVLLGSISYTKEEDYERFLQGLDVNSSVYVMITACIAAQSRGAYSLEESELISKAIKQIKKSSSTNEEKDQ